MRVDAEQSGHADAFLRVRIVLVFLLSAHGVLHALVAYGRPSLAGFLLWAGILGLATAGGEAIGGWLSGLVERTWRVRLQITAWIAYGSILLVAFVGLVTRGGYGDLRGAVAGLMILQPVFLLLAGLGRGHIGAIRNAFVLVVFATAAGGVTAAAAIVGFVGLLLVFLVFDHYARKLAQFPVESAPGVGPAVVASLAYAAPAVLALSAWFLFVDFPAPLRPDRAVAAPPRPVTSEELFAAYRDLVVAALGGGLIVWLSIRLLLGRDRSGRAVKESRIGPARYGAPVRRDGVGARGEGDYSGWRGKIVLLYMAFLAQAAKMGLRRRPDVTPSEFAVRLPGPAPALTEVFERARWGPGELGESDYESAERSRDEVLEKLKGGAK